MNKITYYSFHIDGDDLCEVEKFVTIFNKPAYGEDYYNIMSVIREMGMNRGAEAKYSSTKELQRHYRRHIHQEM
ncbi:hypothetical protein [Chitinophaga pinensis]|nr:hypothetical protein [Chitinophaga pinensis]